MAEARGYDARASPAIVLGSTTEIHHYEAQSRPAHALILKEETHLDSARRMP